MHAGAGPAAHTLSSEYMIAYLQIVRKIKNGQKYPAELDNRMTTKRQPSGCRSGNRGKVRLGKVSIGKASIGACTKAAGPPGRTGLSSPLHFFRIVI